MKGLYRKSLGRRRVLSLIGSRGLGIREIERWIGLREGMSGWPGEEQPGGGFGRAGVGRAWPQVTPHCCHRGRSPHPFLPWLIQSSLPGPVLALFPSVLTA